MFANIDSSIIDRLTQEGYKATQILKDHQGSNIASKANRKKIITELKTIFLSSSGDKIFDLIDVLIFIIIFSTLIQYIDCHNIELFNALTDLCSKLSVINIESEEEFNSRAQEVFKDIKKGSNEERMISFYFGHISSSRRDGAKPPRQSAINTILKAKLYDVIETFNDITSTPDNVHTDNLVRLYYAMYAYAKCSNIKLSAPWQQNSTSHCASYKKLRIAIAVIGTVSGIAGFILIGIFPKPPSPKFAIAMCLIVAFSLCLVAFIALYFVTKQANKTNELVNSNDEDNVVFLDEKNKTSNISAANEVEDINELGEVDVDKVSTEDLLSTMGVK